MTSHVHDDLPQLLRGEATREAVLTAAAHLRECDDCRQELISALTAHASLSATGRLVQLPSLALDPALEVTDAAPLPDLSSFFERIRTEAAQPETAASTDTIEIAADSVHPATDDTDTSAQHVVGSRRWGRLVAAAVLGVLVGAGGAVVAQQLSNGSTSSQTVQLAAYDTGTVPASATLVGGDEMRMDAASLPDPGDGKLYEVWLTNASRTRLYAVGSLGSDRKGSFTVSSGLLPEYSAIEVSVQPITDSAYSGVSVLRGSYS